MIAWLARDVLPPDAGGIPGMHPGVERLIESQMTGAQPQEGDLSLTEASNMLLSVMFAEEVWA